MTYTEINILTDTGQYPDCFNLLRPEVDRISKDYDFILVDAPPAMGMITANVFNTVDDIIIPLQPEQFAFRSVGENRHSSRKVHSF